MKEAKVSIIVPCYNQAIFLDECLKSVLNQTHQNWECIIVNDGGQDNADEIVQIWQKKDIRFKHISKKNGGLSSARNAGIAIAEGKYILPLDADDYISENYLTECIKILETYNECKISYGKGIKFGSQNGLWNLPKYSFERILTQNIIFCSAVFYKKDWEICGGYDLNMIGGLEDWELWINILKRGGIAIQNQNCIFYYRIKEQSMSIKLQSNNSIICGLRNYIFLKHIEAYGVKYPFEVYQAYIKQKDKFDNLYISKNIFELINAIFERINYLIKNKIKYFLIRMN